MDYILCIFAEKLSIVKNKKWRNATTEGNVFTPLMNVCKGYTLLVKRSVSRVDLSQSKLLGCTCLQHETMKALFKLCDKKYHD